MPTYFGPTNLPPIEAWLLGKPIIYSSHLAKQVGNAALLVNPDNANDLANAMLECEKLDLQNRLAEEGQKKLMSIESERLRAEDELCLILERFSLRRQCWDRTDDL